MKVIKALWVIIGLLSLSFTPANAQPQSKNHSPRITIAKGVIQGINDSGVYMFKGIPYAQPPVGNLRWKPPQPVKQWPGVLKADHFGNGCMQRPIFGDMNFRFQKVSEDCLYLNVWMPVKPVKMKDKDLPVLVWFYGGGFQAGDGSEYRYDGEHIARSEGIIVVTANYRLNIFGFFAYPELTKESPHHASGNYGLMDQVQVLRWVQKNISAFGGDPDKVTIEGESAGSMSVSGLMASPLSQGLFRAAIGESGGFFGALAPVSLSEAEKRGKKFAQMAGTNSLAELRDIPASKLLKESARKGSPRFGADIDGYYLPKQPAEIFASGNQAHVPMLVGWNSEEMSGQVFLRGKKPTPQNFKERVKKAYRKHASQILKLFPHFTKKQVKQSATRIASDGFTAFATWKWAELQSQTGNSPVYLYYFRWARPKKIGSSGKQRAAGAVHSAEIEYFMGNLSTNRVYDWQPVDFKISRISMEFVANFVKTGNPNGNGLGLPMWIPYSKDSNHYVMSIGAPTYLKQVQQRRKQLLYLDKLPEAPSIF